VIAAVLVRLGRALGGANPGVVLIMERDPPDIWTVSNKTMSGGTFLAALLDFAGAIAGIWQQVES
jgi:hypothetical protein